MSEYFGFPLSVSFHQCSTHVSVYMLLLTEGQPSQKSNTLLEIGEALDGIVFSLFHRSQSVYLLGRWSAGA
jgi:hypothetical protein